jgi:DNA transformation protein and related proteins
MPTKQSTADFILDQLALAGDVSARKMFSGYALYCDTKVVGLICNDTLFIKITEQGMAFVGKDYQEGRAYDGARPSMMIDDGQLEDSVWLSKLVRITADSLPVPELKKAKNKKK